MRRQPRQQEGGHLEVVHPGDERAAVDERVREGAHRGDRLEERAHVPARGERLPAHDRRVGERREHLKKELHSEIWGKGVCDIWGKWVSG